MELKIEEYKLPKQIDFNYDELKKQIEKSLEKYQNLVVTQENLNDSEKARTTLRGFKKALDEQRKAIKKKWNEPYDAFEKNIKELLALVDKPILALDKQISVFEEKSRNEKMERIQNFITEQLFSFMEENKDCPFDTNKIIIDERWFNKTFKDKDIVDSIKQQFQDQLDDYEASERDIELIKTVYETFPDDAYRKSISLAKYLERYKYTRNVNDIVKAIKEEYAKNKQTANNEGDWVVDSEPITDPFAGLSTSTTVLTKEQCKEMINTLIVESDYDDYIKNELLRFMEER